MGNRDNPIIQSFFENLNLTLVDMVILQNISQYSTYTLRFKILENLNNILPENQKLTPTKFYYSVRKLETMKLIESRQGDKLRSIEIKVTKKALTFLAGIVNSIIFSQINTFDLIAELAIHFLKERKLANLENCMVVLPRFEQVVRPQKVLALTQFFKKMYFLVSDQDYESFLTVFQNKSQNLPSSISLVRREETRIQEASDVFDCVIYLVYHSILDQMLFLESIRVSKPAGLIVTAAFSLPEFDHFLVDYFSQIFIANPYYLQTPKTFQEIFTKDRFSEQGIFQYKGLVLGWGIVKKPRTTPVH